MPESYTQQAAAPRRRWPLIVVAPLYCVLVATFFVMGWLIFSWPTTDTAKTLALLVMFPVFLIVGAMLLAKWII